MERAPRARETGLPGNRLALVLLLVALCAASWWLRARGLGAALPARPMGDEEVFVHQLQILRGELLVSEDDYRQGIYPRLVPWIASLLPSAEPPSGELAAAGAEHRLLRQVSVLLSLLALPATWFLARRFLSAPGATLAAALCAASALAVWYAPQARPHGAAAGLTPLALLACVRLLERPSLARYLVAGCACALALAALHSGVLLLLPLAAAHALRAGRASLREGWKLALACLPPALALRLAYPWLFASAAGGPAALGLVRPEEGLLTPIGFQRLASGAWDFEPVLLLGLLVAGFTWASAGAARLPLRARPGFEAGLLLALWAVAYLSAFGSYRHTTQRYLLPLVPLACLVAAAGALALGRRIGLRRGWAAAPALLLFGAQLAGAWRLGEVRARPWTAELAAEWVRSRLATDETLRILPSLILPLRTRPELLPEGDPHEAPLWIGWQKLHAAPADAPCWSIARLPLGGAGALDALRRDPRAYVDGLGAGLVMIEVLDRPFLRELRAGLRERGERVAVIAPGNADSPDERPYLPRDSHGEYPREFCWLWRSFGVQRFGTRIEVYRLPARG